MYMISVNSSVIRAVGYDGYFLAVIFHHSPKIYMHPRVPEPVYAGLVRASSKGRYYSQNIRER